MTKLRPKDSQFCGNCKAMQPLTAIVCDKCGTKLIICRVCERGFTLGEDKITCVHCKNTVHKIHVVKSKCPICNKILFLRMPDRNKSSTA